MFGTKIYGIWAAMIRRCNNKNDINCSHYGGRGIKVSRSWRWFPNFYKDMGARPEGRSLDRTNNDKGYYKGNCRWATYHEQARNNTRNRFISYDGKRLCLKDWGVETGIAWGTIQRRLDIGWTVKDALAAPVGSKRNDHVILSLNGESLTIGAWTKRLGASSTSTIRARLNSGWTMEKALTAPVIVYRRKS